MLRELDPEFDELFKVAAEFESDVERTPETVSLYAQMLASLVRAEKLRSFTREAFARIIEHSARLAGDANRLSARTRRLADLMRESDYFAGQAGRNSVDVQDVMRSLKEAEDRRGRIREAIQREILRDTIQIATDGATVGSINGLAVAIQGDAAFAHPVRITAAVWPGKGDIIDIERETELGGQIHSKGVFILSAFLASRFSRAKPLSLSASLVFEQSYGPVEGDSASLAELCVLISAISGVPIHQGIAMTGSVNQHGVAQAIGGASEKIEGFFDICKARGLTGSQGVIIPSSNIKHLMIRREIQEACEAGTFHIYAVDHVDDAVAILTQLEPGSADENGEFPANTVYGKLVSALDSMSRAGRRVRRQVQGSGSVDSGASDKK
jgi:predicted ATP-dependent protease